MPRTPFSTSMLSFCVALGTAFIGLAISPVSAQDEEQTAPPAMIILADEDEVIEAELPPRLPMEEGDILLEGSIASVDLKRGELVLFAWKFTLPNGREFVMPAPRYKVVRFSPKTILTTYSTDDNTPSLIDANSLVPNRYLAVIGPDAGTNRVLEARLLELGDAVDTTPQWMPDTTVTSQPAPNFPATLPSNAWPQQPKQNLIPIPTQSTKFYGGVREHVAASGLRVGPKFGISTIGGRTSRPNNPTSDHPRGLALDFMVGRDAKRGDMLAAYFEANAEKENVAYIIWKDHMAYPGSRTDWSILVADYGPGMTARHMDHVHVSFLERPNAAGPYLTSALQNGTKLASRNGRRKTK